MKELNFDWLLNGSCLLSDVAMAYFTTCVYPRSAGKRMRDEIERYPNLYAELLEAGYKRPNTLLTPRQICIVIRHWGMPDTVYKWLRQLRSLFVLRQEKVLRRRMKTSQLKLQHR